MTQCFLRRDARDLFLLGVTVALLDFLIPFFFLKELGSSWLNYLFWVVLTSVVILLGYHHVRRWGDET